MKLQNNRLMKIIMWIVAEVILNFLGLDNLADYSEFIFENKANKPGVVIAEVGFNIELNWFQGSDSSSF